MIYADYNATTPCLPEVADLMRQALLEDFGNPSNRATVLGRSARAHVDTARERISKAIGARSDEVIFTSGATEACNLAIFGVVERCLAPRPTILYSAVEHPAVLEPLKHCDNAGAQLEKIAVDAQGQIDLATFKTQLSREVGLVCIMLANNETGICQEQMSRLVDAARGAGAMVFCDATQVLGKLELNLESLGVDFAALSAHKCYGPKGVGALWKRKGLAISPQIRGGGQEAGLRSGTENVAGIAGFGLAAEIAHRELATHQAHLQAMQNQLETTLLDALPGLQIHGLKTKRIPGTSMLTLPGLGRGWLTQLREVAASSGSSCASGTGKESHVLMAMGLSEKDAGNSIRISLGRMTTSDEVDIIAERLIDGANRLRD